MRDPRAYELMLAALLVVLAWVLLALVSGGVPHAMPYHWSAGA